MPLHDRAAATTAAVGEGDSGGPIYEYVGTKVRVYAILSGGESIMSCQRQYSNTCYSMALVTPMSFILSELEEAEVVVRTG